MPALKFTVIKSRKQYNAYCSLLEAMQVTGKLSADARKEKELLTVLIEKWDADHNTLPDLDPVQLLQNLMEQHNMNAAFLARRLGKSKGLISDILNYKKAFSKEMIRELATAFKVSQEAFNRIYPLKAAGKIIGSKLKKTTLDHAVKNTLVPKKAANSGRKAAIYKL